MSSSLCPFDSVSPNEGEVILAEVFQILRDVSIKPITNPYILPPNGKQKCSISPINKKEVLTLKAGKN